MKPYYDEDGITIYHGDCREIDAWWLWPDVMITDPPYGIDYESGHEGRARCLARSLATKTPERGQTHS